VKVGFIPYREPGMLAIMERFRDSVQTNDLGIKSSAFLKVIYVMSYMVECRLLGY
jgi:hypothetical protein